MHKLSGAPGTVSKILWHFTGGPRWNADRKGQEAEPKSPSEAYDALFGILESRKLWQGNYREVVKVKEVQRKYDRKTKKLVTTGTKTVERESAPVCCVADIPIAHLSYHAGRYGKIAVGFHRAAAIKKGFNPVFYTLHDSPALNALHQGLGHLEYLVPGTVREIVLEQITEGLEGLKCNREHLVDASGRIANIAEGLSGIADVVEIGTDSFKNFLAYVKTFDVDEFATIYCEREWRSTREFAFQPDDLAMVVLPKESDEDFFGRFLRESENTDHLVSRAVPIVPWEDLIEH